MTPEVGLGCDVWLRCSDCPLLDVCEATLSGFTKFWRSAAIAVKLDREGRSVEEIATELNKSGRQVERYLKKVEEVRSEEG